MNTTNESTAYMIQVRGLTKVFPTGVKAVDELDLNVMQGEILGLLGPNGAGKTTTIRTLTTLCGFDSGKVLVGGYDVDREPEKVRRCIGVVAQNTGIDYFLTGRENLELQGHLYRMKKKDIEDRVTELAHYFELDAGLDRQVATYSGGMRRKLDIATALIHRPSLLFLDEPTLGLDIKSRKMLWTYIQKLNQETKLTILLTTHYLEEADKLAHRVAIISGGKIRALGTPGELKGKIAGDAVTLDLTGQDWAAQQFVSALMETDYVKDSMWEGNRLHLYVTIGAESVPKISALAGEHSVQILNLTLSSPNLDDVFLKYTGSSMEDDGEESGEEWWKQWAGKGGGGKWQQQWNENSDSHDNHTQSNAEWNSKQWPQEQNFDTASPTKSPGAPDVTGDQPPQQRWSSQETAQWPDQTQAAPSDEDADVTPENNSGDWSSPKQWSEEEAAQWRQRQERASDDKNNATSEKQQGKPKQQDWLKTEATDSWPGNPPKQ